MAARTSTSPIGGIIARTFLNKAIFSSEVSGAAFVRTSRNSCSRDLPLSSAFSLQALDHTVVEIANQDLPHTDLYFAIKKIAVRRCDVNSG
jgi:hypothetical protein